MLGTLKSSQNFSNVGKCVCSDIQKQLGQTCYHRLVKFFCDVLSGQKQVHDPLSGKSHIRDSL